MRMLFLPSLKYKLAPTYRQFFYLLVLLIFLTGCSQSLNLNNPYITRLKNRGPVPLSGNNPYLAANALLIREMEHSAELKGFIKHRGGPSAIQVQKDAFSPLQIDLFYSDKREFYSMEQTDNTWLISGPYRIDRNKLQELTPIMIFMEKGKPDLSIETNTQETVAMQNPQTTNENSKAALNKAATLPPVSLPATSYAEPRKPSVQSPEKPRNIITNKVITAPKEPVVAEMPKNIKNEQPSDLAGIVKLYGKHSAEMTPKGDLVHYVVYPGETLNIISRWYTFSPNNYERIARVNHITDGTLNTGDTIIVPSYMLKNKYRLTEEALSAMEKSLAE